MISFFEELKAEWISCGGIIDDDHDDESATFIITNELLKRDFQLEPCLIAAGFSNFSCNKFPKNEMKPSTLFKSCPDCEVYGDSYGYCKLDQCKQFYSNPLNVHSYGDWNLKISKIVFTEKVDIIQTVMDYILFNSSFKYKTEYEKDHHDFCDEKYKYDSNYNGDFFKYKFSFKSVDNCSLLNWDTILHKSLCCSFTMKTISYKDFGGTDDPILKVLNICGDGNGDCLFVQQNNTVFILDYETS